MDIAVALAAPEQFVRAAFEEQGRLFRFDPTVGIFAEECLEEGTGSCVEFVETHVLLVAGQLGDVEIAARRIPRDGGQVVLRLALLGYLDRFAGARVVDVEGNFLGFFTGHRVGDLLYRGDPGVGLHDGIMPDHRLVLAVVGDLLAVGREEDPSRDAEFVAVYRFAVDDPLSAVPGEGDALASPFKVIDVAALGVGHPVECRADDYRGEVRIPLQDDFPAFGGEVVFEYPVRSAEIERGGVFPSVSRRYGLEGHSGGFFHVGGRDALHGAGRRFEDQFSLDGIVVRPARPRRRPLDVQVGFGNEFAGGEDGILEGEFLFLCPKPGGNSRQQAQKNHFQVFHRISVGFLSFSGLSLQKRKVQSLSPSRSFSAFSAIVSSSMMRCRSPSSTSCRL